MKHVLILLCAVAVTVLLVAGAGFTILSVRGTTYDRESKVYAQRVLREILKKRDEKTLLSVASPELEKSATGAKLDALFKPLNQLGNFENCEPVQGQAHISITLGKAEIVSARYTAKAFFSNGHALCVLGLIMHGDYWYVESLYVRSSARDGRKGVGL